MVFSPFVLALALTLLLYHNLFPVVNRIFQVFVKVTNVPFAVGAVQNRKHQVLFAHVFTLPQKFWGCQEFFSILSKNPAQSEMQ